VTEDKAIGRFDEGLQRLYMEFSKGQHENWQKVQANLKGRDFFRPGPLMRALECERPCVLLIDELDKVDDGFEAMLLEILSAWRLSIPEFGTVEAKSIPFVVLTSNEERRLGDPIRRRSLYVRVEHAHLDTAFCQVMSFLGCTNGGNDFRRRHFLQKAIDHQSPEMSRGSSHNNHFSPPRPTLAP
jgi:MoxR-like ATPase